MTTTATPTIIKGIDVDRLYVDSIDSKPVDFEWDYETNIHFAIEGTWECWESRRPDIGDETFCAECNEDIDYRETPDGEVGWHHTIDDAVDGLEDPDFLDDDHDPEPDDEWKREGCDGPMMNYYCPIELRYDMTHEAAADILADTCLVLVEVHGETGLALSGGGMDLSWEICEAFMLLGSLPPAHFARRLPKMCSTFSDMHRLVLAGARRTLAIQRDWANDALVGLNDIEAWFENEEWKRDR